MVPTVELPPTMPSTSHVIPVFVVPETVALNCCFCVSVSGARRGLMVTVTAANDTSVRLNIMSRRGSLGSPHRRITGATGKLGCALLARVASPVLSTLGGQLPLPAPTTKAASDAGSST